MQPGVAIDGGNEEPEAQGPLCEYVRIAI